MLNLCLPMCCSRLLYVACICGMLLKFAMCAHHVFFVFCYIRCSLLIMCCSCLLYIALCLLILILYIAHCSLCAAHVCFLLAYGCMLLTCCPYLYIAHCSLCVVMSITTMHYNQLCHSTYKNLIDTQLGSSLLCVVLQCSYFCFCFQKSIMFKVMLA